MTRHDASRIACAAVAMALAFAWPPDGDALVARFEAIGPQVDGVEILSRRA